MKQIVPGFLTAVVLAALFFADQWIKRRAAAEPVPTSAQLLARAVTDLENDRPADALRTLDLISQDDRYSSNARKLEGDAYQQFYLWDKAEQHWKEALEIDPSTEGAALALCNVWFLLGKHEEVRKLAAELSPKQLDLNVSAVLLLEAIRQEHERPAAALTMKFVDKVRVREPNNIAARQTVGRCLVELGRVTEGLEQLSAAINASPNDVNTWTIYLRSLNDAGRTNEVLSAWKTAPESVKSHPAAMMVAAQSFETIDDLNTAKKLFADIVSKEPFNRSAHASYAGVLEATGEKEKASEHRATAAKLESIRERQAQLFFTARQQRNDPSRNVCEKLVDVCQEMGWTNLAAAWNKHIERRRF